MDNIRTESFLGGDKVIVGNKYTDLVLETLGKVYIKTGNSSRVLSDVLALLDKATESEIKSQTIIVGSLLEMEQMEYPGDGFFVYNTLTTTLYISYDERYIALIEAAEGAGDGYVRRKGDTMTGQLEINTVGPPLIVASSKLVNNLNAEFISGYAADDLAKKKVDEYITGNWTFKGKGVSENNWTFKENVRMYGDLVTSRSLTSPEFASGFGGYGWKLDADTNTLTVDYLVVRKAMKVYEMVINKISATNGSIWVSNSSKCDSAVQPTILTDAQLGSIVPWSGLDSDKEAALKIIKSGTFYLPIPSNGANTEGIITLDTELSGPSEINTTSKTFVNYKFIVYVKDAVGLVNNPLFTGLQTLYNESLLTSSNGDDNHTQLQKCITLYYISKEIVVTKWGGNEGQWDEGTVPVEWEYRDTFDKKFPMFMIPKGNSPSGKLYTELYELATTQEEARSYVFPIYPYYKYFALDKTLVDTAIAESNSEFNNRYVPSTGVPNLWIVNTDDDEYPLFKAGDIIRCQKYSDGNIKYYDAIVLAQIESRQFIVQKAVSVFDKYTEIHYNEDGSVKEYKEEYNTTQYNKTEQSYSPITGQQESNSTSKTTSSRVDDIASGDDMIQMGNIYDVRRQNAIYLTSCDDDGPFIDVISGLNRPDYSVLYDTPKYRRREIVYKSTKRNYYIQREYVEDAPTVTETNGSETTTLYGTEYPTSTSLFEVKDGKYRHAYTKTTRVRVGNLDGIYNEIFGNKQPYGYGLYGENVFLTGEFYLSNGTSVIDFSEESVLLKFRNAGLEIRDVVNEDGTIDQVPALNLEGEPIPDENGNPTYRNKTEIYMNADQFVFSIAGNLAMKLSGLFNDKGQFQDALLDINGWVQAKGLGIRGDEISPNPPYTPHPELGSGVFKDTTGKYVSENGYYLNSLITTKGDLYTRNGYFNGIVEADSGYFRGRIEAAEGKIGIFEINANGLYYGDITGWGNISYSQDMALVTPGIIRLQRQIGYFHPGDIANMRVGLGDYSDPYLVGRTEFGGASCASAGYFYRQMNSTPQGGYKFNEYYPAVKIISDNVINRDIALYTEGGIICKGGLIETGHTQPDSVSVIDLSFGCNILIHNTTYKYIYLPTLDNIKKVIGYSSGEDFCIRITIIFRYDSTQNGFVAFQDGQTSMYFINNNGGRYGDTIEMGKGDVLELALVYSNGNYYAQVIDRHT